MSRPPKPACVAQGGKAAALTILDMRASGDFSKQSTKEYQRRWIEAYGHDFGMVRFFITRDFE